MKTDINRRLRVAMFAVKPRKKIVCLAKQQKEKEGRSVDYLFNFFNFLDTFREENTIEMHMYG